MPGYAVVDLETTGLTPGRGDRIVELAVVHVSPNGEVPAGGRRWSIRNATSARSAFTA
jgi:DNA polymerase-3 subunit epsilon